MNARLAVLGTLALSATLASGIAQAGPTYCSAGVPHPDGLDVSDVTFRGSNADDCYGVQSGNDLGAQGEFIGWNGFELLVADNSGNNPGSTGSWMGVNWSLSPQANARSGSYPLSWSDPLPLNLPLTLDLVVVTKASDRFASYLFDAELFQASPSSGSGTWEIAFRNNGNQIPKLSHLSIWGRVVPTRVPEPATLGLMALGLAGVAGAAAKRRAAGAATA